MCDFNAPLPSQWLTEGHLPFREQQSLNLPQLISSHLAEGKSLKNKGGLRDQGRAAQLWDLCFHSARDLQNAGKGQCWETWEQLKWETWEQLK